MAAVGKNNAGIRRVIGKEKKGVVKHPKEVWALLTRGTVHHAGWPVLLLVFLVGVLSMVVLFPVEEASRPLEEKHLGGQGAPLIVLGGAAERVQHNVASLWLGVGQGSAPGGDYDDLFLILDGRAFLREEDASQPPVSRALVDVREAVGLFEPARPSKVFSLPEGRPVSWADLRSYLANRVSEQAFFLGTAELTEAAGWEGKRGVLTGFWPAPGKQIQESAVWLETPVPMQPVMTPAEMVAAARAGCAGTAPVNLNAGARVRQGVFYVWESDTMRSERETVIDPPMVDLGVLAPDIVLDIRYATSDNFVGQPVYPIARCLVVRPVAERLVRVNQEVRRQGYRLKVYDGYRPTSAHWRLWELSGNKDYLANPWSGSRHSRGAAVDVTLVTLDGQPVEMPTAFDTFSEKAHRDAAMSRAARHHLDILTRAMLSQGFYPIQCEWWHYDYLGWAGFPLRDVPLD